MMIYWRNARNDDNEEKLNEKSDMAIWKYEENVKWRESQKTLFCECEEYYMTEVWPNEDDDKLMESRIRIWYEEKRIYDMREWVM